jgi:hypothetical protein
MLDKMEGCSVSYAKEKDTVILARRDLILKYNKKRAKLNEKFVKKMHALIAVY